MSRKTGLIIVRKDSGINRLEEVVGKTVAVEEPYSTMSYFIPKTVFTEGLEAQGSRRSVRQGGRQRGGLYIRRG